MSFHAKNIEGKVVKMYSILSKGSWRLHYKAYKEGNLLGINFQDIFVHVIWCEIGKYFVVIARNFVSPHSKRKNDLRELLQEFFYECNKMNTSYLIIMLERIIAKEWEKGKQKRDKVITSAQKNYCNNQIVFTSWIGKKEIQNSKSWNLMRRVSSLVKHFSQAKKIEYK